MITETATNKEASVLAPPGPGLVLDAPKLPAPKRNPKIDAIFVYTWTRGLAFSPDGTELAAYSMHPSPRLIVWNAKGELGCCGAYASGSYTATRRRPALTSSPSTKRLQSGSASRNVWPYCLVSTRGSKSTTMP